MKSAEEDAAWIQNHRRWSREGEGNLRNKERKSNETNSEEEKEHQGMNFHTSWNITSKAQAWQPPPLLGVHLAGGT